MRTTLMWAMLRWLMGSRRGMLRTALMPARVTRTTFPVVLVRSRRTVCRWLLAVMIAVSGLSAASLANAAPEATEAPKERVEHKAMTGKLVSLTKRALNVEYSATETESFEQMFHHGPDTQLVRVKTMDELKPGDTVKVEYAQTYQERAGGQWELIGTQATTIALVRRSIPADGLMSRETSE